MAQILSQAFNLASRAITSGITRNFQALPSSVINGVPQSKGIPNAWSFDSVMERNTFRPNEWKRVKKLGWYAKVSTRNGRKLIMRRILKGRYVLTH